MSKDKWSSYKTKVMLIKSVLYVRLFLCFLFFLLYSENVFLTANCCMFNDCFVLWLRISLDLCISSSKSGLLIFCLYLLLKIFISVFSFSLYLRRLEWEWCCKVATSVFSFCCCYFYRRKTMAMKWFGTVVLIWIL